MIKQSWIIVILLGVVILFSSMKMVPEGYFGVRVNEGVKTAEPDPDFLSPGLHWHWPLWQHMILINEQTRALVVDGSAKNPYLLIKTFDGHALNVAYVLVWKVTDRAPFYKASLKEDPAIAIRQEADQVVGADLETQTTPQITSQANTENNLEDALSIANKNLSSHGVKVLSALITSVAVAETERPNYVAHMQEQQNVALDALQKQTATLTQSLHDAIDAKANQLLKKGEAAAAKIKSDADLAATDIYAQAYHQSPEFYQYFHNLQL